MIVLSIQAEGETKTPVYLRVQSARKNGALIEALNLSTLWSTRVHLRQALFQCLSMIVEFPTKHADAPMRCEYMPLHSTLCSLFDEESPVIEFLREIVQRHQILTVRDWDKLGGPYLFEKYKLDNAVREEFCEVVGKPFRPQRHRARE